MNWFILLETELKNHFAVSFYSQFCRSFYQNEQNLGVNNSWRELILKKEEESNENNSSSLNCSFENIETNYKTSKNKYIISIHSPPLP